MGEGLIRLADGQGTAVELRRSRRARRLSLRVSSLDGKVTLTLPPGVSEREARRFVEEKSDWIAGALSRRPDEVRVTDGADVPVEGIARRVVPGTGRSARLLPSSISAPSGREGPAIAALLKSLARDRLAQASDRHARALGRSYSRLTLRDTRSRWGSCSTEGNLMYSWRLILAPPEVLDYVAAHEVAHLARMDHSPAFWAEVRALCPHYAEPRAWLRREGAGLHRFRFSAD